VNIIKNITPYIIIQMIIEAAETLLVLLEKTGVIRLAFEIQSNVVSTFEVALHFLNSLAQ